MGYSVLMHEMYTLEYLPEKIDNFSNIMVEVAEEK